MINMLKKYLSKWCNKYQYTIQTNYKNYQALHFWSIKTYKLIFKHWKQYHNIYQLDYISYNMIKCYRKLSCQYVNLSLWMYNVISIKEEYPINTDKYPLYQLMLIAKYGYRWLSKILIKKKNH